MALNGWRADIDSKKAKDRIEYNGRQTVTVGGLVSWQIDSWQIESGGEGENWWTAETDEARDSKVSDEERKDWRLKQIEIKKCTTNSEGDGQFLKASNRIANRRMFYEVTATYHQFGSNLIYLFCDKN